MYIQVTKSMFHNQFHVLNRVEQFSYGARSLLFDYLTETEDNGENGNAGLEMDIIGICCDFAESTIKEFISDYNLEEDTKDLKEKELENFIEDYINNNFIFIGNVDTDGDGVADTKQELIAPTTDPSKEAAGTPQFIGTWSLEYALIF